jgi:cation transport ATPase
VRNMAVWERAARADTIVLDKTGTLTEGRPQVTDFLGPGLDRREILALAASLERCSEHPLAGAIIRAAEEEQNTILFEGGKAFPPAGASSGLRPCGVSGSLFSLPAEDGRAEVGDDRIAPADVEVYAGEGIAGRFPAGRLALGNEVLLARLGYLAGGRCARGGSHENLDKAISLQNSQSTEAAKSPEIAHAAQAFAELCAAVEEKAAGQSVVWGVLDGVLGDTIEGGAAGFARGDQGNVQDCARDQSPQFFAFIIGDALRPGAAKLIRYMQKRGLRVVLASGDREEAVRHAAHSLGVDEYHGAMSPQDKHTFVADLCAAGRAVVMVGDGINDGPALARADVGISPGQAADLARASGDVLLPGGDIAALARFMLFARRVFRKIRQNLFWAFAYNLICIPIAAGALIPFGGPMLDPMFAGLAMSLSSLSVVCSALLLRMPEDPLRRGGARTL